LRHELNADGEPHHDAPGTIVFHIPAGTGSHPWNTREHAVVAKAFQSSASGSATVRREDCR